MPGTYAFECGVFVFTCFDCQAIPEMNGDLKVWGDEGRDTVADGAGIQHESWSLSLEAGYAF